MWQVIIGCVKKSVLEGVTLALLGLPDDSVLRSPIMKGNFTNIRNILRVEDCVDQCRIPCIIDRIKEMRDTQINIVPMRGS
jgi:hypothetical protein